MTVFRKSLLALCVIVLASCAGSNPDTTNPVSQQSEIPQKKPDTPETELGRLSVYAVNILGRDLDGRVELYGTNSTYFRMPLDSGQASDLFPEGPYTILVSVYSEGIPIVAEVEEVTLSATKEEFITLNLVEGAGASMPLWRFDQDFDMVMDRVEIALGTNPADASDIPGRTKLDWESPVLAPGAGWYRGDLHVHSEYHETSLGKGSESVREIIRRAERAKLDFIAIADRNTVESVNDPDYESNSVVLIPAMEWGTDDAGVALLYGPRVVPDLVQTAEEAQAVARMIQAQGGVVVAAHPCFPIGAWTWGLGYLNGVQVWCREWGGVPGITPEVLPSFVRQQENGSYVNSIALAANHTSLTANEQAERFWIYELQKGLKASVYGGSESASDKVPIAEPITYVYAPEKSVRGILRGMWSGVTFISSGIDGPVVRITADVRADGRYDVGIGGTIPIGVPTQFFVEVGRAKGKKLQIWHNGSIILSKTIEEDGYVHTFTDTPSFTSFYHVRVIETAQPGGLGASEVLAVSSPVYAQEVYIESESLSIHDMWIRLKNEYDQPLGVTPELDPAAKDAYEIKPQYEL